MKTLKLSLLCILALFQGCTAGKSLLHITTDWHDSVLPAADAEVAARIEEYRKGNVSFQLQDAEGNPFPEGTEISISLKNHEFLFGCNFFQWGQLDYDPPARDGYRQKFSELMNYATLPFYWGYYERFDGKPDFLTKCRETALWCRERGITMKGHPLVWHEVYPDWAMGFSEEEMLSRLEARVIGIVSDYEGLIDLWDVINESQVSARYDNPLGRWVKRVGPNEAVAEAFSWAEGANPDGTFIINDFDVLDESYYEQIKALIDGGTIPDAIGVQSHMHHGVWSDGKILSVYNRLEKLNLPIHFTELTVLSGPLMKNFDYQSTRTDWKTTKKGEDKQALDLVRIYRMLFSLPKIEAVTYWDFSDRFAWLGAPAGLVREDMTPKPAWMLLMKLVHDEWHTGLTVKTDAEGKISFRGFYGDYLISTGGKAAVFRFFSKKEPSAKLRLE